MNWKQIIVGGLAGLALLAIANRVQTLSSIIYGSTWATANGPANTTNGLGH